MPPLPIPFSKINQQELQIETAFSGARPQFHLDQRLEDSVLRGPRDNEKQRQRKETKEREIHRERSGESVRHRHRTKPEAREMETDRKTDSFTKTEINKEEKQRWENRERGEMERNCMETETGRN